MKFTGRRRIAVIVAAIALALLALVGGIYGGFVNQDPSPINSAASSITFTDSSDNGSFGATYSRLAAGDRVVSFVDLKNDGARSLASFRISQASTDRLAKPGGKAGVLESAGGEGLSVKIEQVDGAGTVIGTNLATTKLAKLKAPPVAIPLTLAPDAVAHLKFTVTLDQEARVQHQSLSTIYTVKVNQSGHEGTQTPSS